MSTARRAFTLIELTVVIAIVSILAAILVPVFMQPFIAERRSEAQREMGAIEQAILGRPEAGEPGYLSSVGALPSQVSDLIFKPATVNAPTVSGGIPQVAAGNMVVGWVGPYLRVGTQNPLNDPWGRPYTFVTGGVAPQKTWRIHSDGPDRTANTADDLDYPGAGTPASPGAPYASVVTNLLVRLVRLTGPAQGSIPVGTRVDLTVADGFGNVLAPTSGVTFGTTPDTSGWVTFTGGKIPLGRIGVKVTLDGTTYDRVITATRPTTVATVTVPTPGAKYREIFVPRCTLTTTPTAVAKKVDCGVGYPLTTPVLPGQTYEVTVNGGISTSDATKPCFAAVSLGDDSTGANLASPASYVYQPLATSSTLANGFSLTRTFQYNSSGSVAAPGLTLYPTGGATCSLTGATLLFRTWDP